MRARPGLRWARWPRPAGCRREPRERSAGRRRGGCWRRGGRRGLGRRTGARLQRADEPVSLPRQRLDVARRVGVVAERTAEAAHRAVQRRVEVDDARRPERRLQVVAGDDLARPRQQRLQHGERLALQPDADIPPDQLAGVPAQPPAVETQLLGRVHARDPVVRAAGGRAFVVPLRLVERAYPVNRVRNMSGPGQAPSIAGRGPARQFRGAGDRRLPDAHVAPADAALRQRRHATT
jgi:hypothetical protein